MLCEMVTNGNGIWPYKICIVEFKDVLGCLVSCFRRQLEETETRLLLHDILKIWVDNKEKTEFCSNVFAPIDNVPDFAGVSIVDTAKRMWVELVLPSPTIREAFAQETVEVIHAERTGEIMDTPQRYLIVNWLTMLMDIGSDAYKEIFERPFVACSTCFYKEKLQKLIHSGKDDPAMCILIEAENKRLSLFLDQGSSFEGSFKVTFQGTVDNFFNNVAAELINDHNCWDDSYEELKMLYMVLKNLPGDKCVQLWSSMVQTITSLLNATDADRVISRNPIMLVENIIKLQMKFNKIVDLSFSMDKKFQYGVQISIRDHIISVIGRKYWAEFLVLYIHKFLQSGVNFIEEESGSSLAFIHEAATLSLYACPDKFEERYKELFASRFFSQRWNEVMEKTMFLKLVRWIGVPFERELQFMLDDIKFSQRTLQRFSPNMESLEFSSLNLLTGAFWSVNAESSTVNLPPEIQVLFSNLETFVAAEHQHETKVIWRTWGGRAIIEAEFAGGRTYDLNVNTYAMCILSLFNSETSLSLRQISQQTRIPDVALWKNLKSLACVRGTNVLRKEPKNRPLSEHDVFYFNERFTSSSKEVTINPEVLPSKAISVRKSDEIWEAICTVRANRRRIHKQLRIDFLTLLSDTWNLREGFTPDPYLVKMVSRFDEFCRRNQKVNDWRIDFPRVPERARKQGQVNDESILGTN
ncbi:hypothetical protein ACP4OV_014913 [Aristida adscensionis]